jgi:hypothetical protein
MPNAVPRVCASYELKNKMEALRGTSWTLEAPPHWCLLISFLTQYYYMAVIYLCTEKFLFWNYLYKEARLSYRCSWYFSKDSSFLKGTQWNKTNVTCKFTDIGFFVLHFLIPAFGSNFLYSLVGKERSINFLRGRVRNSHLSLHERELLTTPSTFQSEPKVCIQVEGRRAILLKETVKLLSHHFLKLTCLSFKRFLSLITEFWSILTVSLLTIEDVDFIMLIISAKLNGYFIYHQVKKRGKLHPCTGTEALYRPYGP